MSHPPDWVICCSLGGSGLVALTVEGTCLGKGEKGVDVSLHVFLNGEETCCFSCNMRWWDDPCAIGALHVDHACVGIHDGHCGNKVDGLFELWRLNKRRVEQLAGASIKQ